MRTLLPEESLQAKHADEAWGDSLTDKLLDMHFAGTPPPRMAVELGRKPKAIWRQIEMFTRNERGRAVNYHPHNRTSREGKRFTENDDLIVQAYRKLGLGVSIAAKVTQHSTDELRQQSRRISKAEVRQEVVEAKSAIRSANTKLAPTLDFIWAHRYIYFVYKTPILPDKVYDAMVEEEIEYGGGEDKFLEIKNHHGWPDYIKSLALYLCGKQKEGK